MHCIVLWWEMHATIISLFSTVPVDDAQVVQVLKSQYDLCWVELGTTFIKTSHLYTHKLSFEKRTSQTIQWMHWNSENPCIGYKHDVSYQIYMEYTIHEYMTTFQGYIFFLKHKLNMCEHIIEVGTITKPASYTHLHNHYNKFVKPMDYYGLNKILLLRMCILPWSKQIIRWIQLIQLALTLLM